MNNEEHHSNGEKIDRIEAIGLKRIIISLAATLTIFASVSAAALAQKSHTTATTTVLSGTVAPAGVDPQDPPILPY